MKKRNPLAVVCLSIITLGIYDIFWLVKTKKVLNKTTKVHVPSIWLLLLPVPIVIIGYIILFANTASTTSTSYSTYGETTTTTAKHPGLFFIGLLAVFLGFFVGFVISIIWFYKFSKSINEYTNGKMSTAVSFLILWIIHLIGVALIQDTFNDMVDNGIMPSQNPQLATAVANPYQQQPVYNQAAPNTPYAPLQPINQMPAYNQAGDQPMPPQNIPNQAYNQPANQFRPPPETAVPQPVPPQAPVYQQPVPVQNQPQPDQSVQQPPQPPLIQ